MPVAPMCSRSQPLQWREYNRPFSYYIPVRTPPAQQVAAFALQNSQRTLENGEWKLEPLGNRTSSLLNVSWLMVDVTRITYLERERALEAYEYCLAQGLAEYVPQYPRISNESKCHQYAICAASRSAVGAPTGACRAIPPYMYHPYWIRLDENASLRMESD